MIRKLTTNKMMSIANWPLKSAAITGLLALSVATAVAQYTPGTDGSNVPPIPPTPPALPAQLPPPGDVRVVEPAPPAPVQVVQQPVVPQLGDAQMADLTASIALYPDPLLAEMLPAATYVEELTFAERWLSQHPGADERMIAGLPLDPSVKAMMHYPQALTLMTDHLDWTQAVGLAFVSQPADVMGMIQRWRYQAYTSGNLASSPQWQVLLQGNTVMIMPPPNSNVIYVPVYDPAVVYVRPIRPIRNVITFQAGGFSLQWIDNDVDWRTHEVRVPVIHDGDRPRSDVTVDLGPGERDRPDSKRAFVREQLRPSVAYPAKIVTPQPDHKEISIMPPSPR